MPHKSACAPPESSLAHSRRNLSRAGSHLAKRGTTSALTVRCHHYDFNEAITPLVGDGCRSRDRSDVAD